ncbi:hypothetical protein CASFOL_012069 [Castilleja foliolosa]|uniref:Uncharacterized protein n=1 Tax=Castilleja foliolosa TaxID=1961234 RepID=A0ABD3DR92_9LAMI
MMYEQQQVMRLNNNMKSKRQIHMDNRRRSDNKTRIDDEDEKNKVEIVDLSGLSLNVLPNPPLHLATISKLDLSNNNLQEHSRVIDSSAPKRDRNGRAFESTQNTPKFYRLFIKAQGFERVRQSSSIPSYNYRKLQMSLEELNANFNQLKQLPETIGFELLNLRKLSVNSNKLVFLPHSTSHLTNLRVLDARLNCLQSLPDDLENLINLQILNISQNFQHLATLPYSIGLLISLLELDVSYNKITVLPESIGCLNKLKKLSVEGNPLVSPPMEIVEQGLETVKEYLCDKINGTSKSTPKKSSWFGKLKKCGTFSGVKMPVGDREGYIMPSYRSSIDGLASPRYMGMFSPKRIFSPKTYFSR